MTTDDIVEADWFQQARALSTAEVSDALDALNLPGSALGIRPIAGPARLFGLAFTVRFAPIDRFNPGTVGDFEGFDVRFLGVSARISQSRFEFFNESASTATQVMEEASPTTTLKYVESQSCVWMDGERYELEPRQRLIIIALLEDLDHELDKGALQRKCGSQSQSFSPSKEFERNKQVYKRFIHYLRDDERYQLQIPLEDQTH